MRAFKCSGLAANAAVALITRGLLRNWLGLNRHRRPAKQARRLAVPGGSCGGLWGGPSSPPPTACLRSVGERVRPPALGAEGSWRRLCGGRNARIAAAHPHCTGPSRIAASPHRTFTRGDCFQDRQPKARDERSGQGRRKALALALTASEAALTLPLLEQSPTPSGTKNNP